MANYRTHCSFGIVSGLFVSAVGLTWIRELQPDVLFLGAFAGYLGGLAPDLDHDNSVALSDIYSQMTTIVPAAILTVLLSKGGGWEISILLALVPAHYALSKCTERFFFPTGRVQRFSLRARMQAILIAGVSGAGVLLVIQTRIPFVHALGIVLCAAIVLQVTQPLFQRLTIHRGVFHSVPAMLIYTEIVYLYLFRLPFDQRLIVTAAGLAGFFSHLLLDELYSVDLENRRLKRSFGTALSLWKGKTPGLSLGTYLLAAGLLAFCFVR